VEDFILKGEVEMTNIELQALTVIRNYLPRLVAELKRIADALETKTVEKERTKDNGTDE
jgi:hypothetical protein